MSDIYFRSINKKDIPQMKHLINQCWGVWRFTQKKATLDSILSSFLYLTMSDSNYGKAAVEDGRVVGIIFGNLKHNKKRVLKKKNMLALIWSVRTFLTATRVERSNIWEYYSKIIRANEGLIGKRKRFYDGSIQLFAVSSQCQGKQIGSELLKILYRDFNRKGVGKIYVYTDTTCNYGFYEHKGFRLVESRKVTVNLKPQGGNVTVFLYEYDLTGCR